MIISLVAHQGSVAGLPNLEKLLIHNSLGTLEMISQHSVAIIHMDLEMHNKR